ncbi:MAG: transcription elongation factor GreA [Eubacterium sp.]|nr:transcription elongation factor GreA [Eubacterium sp.]
MGEDKKLVFTKSQVKDLENELKDLKLVKRDEVAEKIKVARAQGDLSENAEYDAAKDEQAKIEARIREIENMLKNKEVIRDKDMDASVIGIGRAFKIRDMELKETMEYEMVNSTNANTLMGKISDESPVGRGLVGHKKGETVKIELGDREVKYKILDVQKA